MCHLGITHLRGSTINSASPRFVHFSVRVVQSKSLTLLYALLSCFFHSIALVFCLILPYEYLQVICVPSRGARDQDSIAVIHFYGFALVILGHPSSLGDLSEGLSLYLFEVGFLYQAAGS